MAKFLNCDDNFIHCMGRFGKCVCKEKELDKFCEWYDGNVASDECPCKGGIIPSQKDLSKALKGR